MRGGLACHLEDDVRGAACGFLAGTGHEGRGGSDGFLGGHGGEESCSLLGDGGEAVDEGGDFGALGPVDEIDECDLVGVRHVVEVDVGVEEVAEDFGSAVDLVLGVVGVEGLGLWCGRGRAWWCGWRLWHLWSPGVAAGAGACVSGALCLAVGFKMPRRIGDANGVWWRDGKLRALVVSAGEIFVDGGGGRGHCDGNRVPPIGRHRRSTLRRPSRGFLPFSVFSTGCARGLTPPVATFLRPAGPEIGGFDAAADVNGTVH